MMTALTARYVKISSGYMGQILEWPEVVTEGEDLEACRESLRDAARQMALAYRDMGKKPPWKTAKIRDISKRCNLDKCSYNSYFY